MIISKRGRGLIGSGDTPLRWTGSIEQSGPMALVVHGGEYVGSAGQRTFEPQSVQVPETVVPVLADPVYPMTLEIYVLPNGDLEVIQNPLAPDVVQEQPTSPLNPPLVGFGTIIPPGCTDLTAVDVNVLRVIRGWLEYPQDDDTPYLGGKPLSDYDLAEVI